MDQVRNPFNPGAGSQPPLLVGREAQIGAMTVAVRRLAIGRFERSVMLKGLRGVGKTVLLNEFGRIAQQEGWIDRAGSMLISKQPKTSASPVPLLR